MLASAPMRVLKRIFLQVGEVISRFERKGFKLVALKMQTATRGLAEEHYKELSAKPFFKDLVDYIISGPVICMVRVHCRTPLPCRSHRHVRRRRTHTPSQRHHQAQRA